MDGAFSPNDILNPAGVHWAFGVFFFRESEGCLVALAVFKTVAVRFGGRGRFDSYPLRFSLFLSLYLASKGGDSMPRERNPHFNIALIERWVSSQVEPTGPATGLAAASDFSWGKVIVNSSTSR